MASIQKISDKDKLRQLFDEDLSVEGSRESLIVPAQIFKQLEEFELNFEPYLSLARTCQLTSFSHSYSYIPTYVTRKRGRKDNTPHPTYPNIFIPFL